MVEISFDNAMSDFLEVLEQHGVWVLATSQDGRVTTRSMSLLCFEGSLYFQTHSSYLKFHQMQANPQVSLCCGSYSIDGTAECLGP